MEQAEFEKHVNGIVNSGLTSLAIALGNELGLFDLLCNRFEQPASVVEIAEAANLKPRYVQEWLGCMVAADVIRIVSDGDVNKYVIPEKHRDIVTKVSRASSAIPMLANRQSRIKTCFLADGPYGFDYSQTPDTVEWQTSLNAVTVPAVCESDILPSVDHLTPRLEEGCWVAEIGCGSGTLTTYLAEKFPQSSFIGLDSSAFALNIAQGQALTSGVCNVTWQQADVHELPESWIACFDWVIMLDVLHDLADPSKALLELKRILKQEGTLTVLEPSLSSRHEQNAGNQTAAADLTFSMYGCLPCSLADGPKVKTPGVGLDNMAAFITESGFEMTNVKAVIENDGQTIITCRKATTESGETIEPHLEQTELSLGFAPDD